MMVRSHTYLFMAGITLFLYTTYAISADEYSDLWGKKGERWSPTSRLPDVSWAGYHHGEKDIPNLPVAANVKDFGAIGDGVHDDSDAFLQAIEATESGAIFIPNGNYVIKTIIEIEKPNIVLRGESRDGVILHFPTPLQEIRPNWGATTGGRMTSNYAWSGGFIWVKGSYRSKELARISKPARRGDDWIAISSIDGLKTGQWVDIRQRDTDDNSLARHLYLDDAGEMEKLRGRTRTSLTSRIKAIDSNRIQVERPLRCDIRPKWQPALHAFEPTITEVGIENLSFEFPVTSYEGHFTEMGFNAIAISDAAHSWVRNIRV